MYVQVNIQTCVHQDAWSDNLRGCVNIRMCAHVRYISKHALFVLLSVCPVPSSFPPHIRGSRGSIATSHTRTQSTWIFPFSIWGSWLLGARDCVYPWMCNWIKLLLQRLVCMRMNVYVCIQMLLDICDCVYLCTCNSMGKYICMYASVCVCRRMKAHEILHVSCTYETV